MRFIDYPDHLPRGPLTPEAAAIYERLKEMALRLDIKIEVPKRTHSGEAIDFPITLHRAPVDGPLVLTVLKHRPPKETPCT